MKPKVYIDGRAGTTGLQIEKRLQTREDITLLSIDPALRKDGGERKRLMHQADIAFLCLPDKAAIEAVALAENSAVRIIDASTAHRTNPNWVYGFPELAKSQREAIRSAKRVANPGCHATGFISLVYPLVKMGILPADYPLSCYSLTGYSGGGNSMISMYEAENRDIALDSPRIYGLDMRHKHLPEMEKLTGISPLFSPVVADFPQGMATTVMLENKRLSGVSHARDLQKRLADYYAGETFVKVASFGGEAELAEPVLYANALADTNFLEIFVFGHESQTTLIARFDNLGKGASGAAVQNMNLMLGFPETAGLI